MRGRAYTISLCAVLTALALVLSLVESALPIGAIVPLPGIRLGLANVVTLVALYRLGTKQALAIVLCRVLLLFLLTGRVNALFLSLCGALLSLIVMAALLRALSRKLTIFGVSVAGAAAHAVGQIACAMVLTATSGVVFYLPVLLVCAVPSGLLTAVCANGLLRLKVIK